LSKLHCVVEQSRRNFRQECPTRFCHVGSAQPLETDRGELVIVLQSPTGVSRRPGADKPRVAERLKPFAQTPLVGERTAVKRDARPEQERGAGRGPTEQLQKRKITG